MAVGSAVTIPCLASREVMGVALVMAERVAKNKGRNFMVLVVFVRWIVEKKSECGLFKLMDRWAVYTRTVGTVGTVARVFIYIE
jgi:hypothetical protein